MSYIGDNLMTDEKIVYIGSQAIYKFIPWFLMSFLIFASYFALTGNAKFGALALGVLLLWVTSLRYGSVEFAITDKRLLVKKGIFSLTTVELFFHTVESVVVKKSFIGMIFSVGDIIVTGTGTQKESVSNVKNPDVFKKIFLEEKQKYEEWHYNKEARESSAKVDELP